MKRYCLTLDLIDDPLLIAKYEGWHKSVWPEIKASILDSGITGMEIYRFGNRLFMIIAATENFTFEEKQQKDASNPCVLEWEKLMWKYQQTIPGTKPGEKWVLMDQIFSLT